MDVLQPRLCGGRSRGLFVGLGFMSGGLEQSHEVWDVRGNSARHRTLNDKCRYAATWAAGRGHAPFGVPAGKHIDTFDANVATLDTFLFELC